MTTDYAARSFKEGDLVEFELARDGVTPRWDFPHDWGWSGDWQRAKVVHVSRHSVLVSWQDRGCQRYWYWPLKDHPEFSESQWDQPGFLRHATTREVAAQATPAHAPAPRLCDCLKDVLMTQGCQCGGA